MSASLGTLIRTVIVDDSRSYVAALSAVLADYPDFRLLGVARDGTEAVELVTRLRPDLVIMDAVMPGLDGVSATAQIMSVAPCAVVVMSRQFDADLQEVIFDALRAGAVDFLPKPRELQERRTRDRLVDTLRAMSGVKVVRRRPVGPALPERNRAGEFQLVAIGSSTGGPPALCEIFRQLSPDFPAPILVAQHIASGFSLGLSRWLSGSTPLKSMLVEQPLVPEAGTVYFPADDHHLQWASGKLIAARANEPGVVPSVDRLFHSLLPRASSVVAVMLTGMGADGAAGMSALRAAGAHTLVQDEVSSVVYGMPRAAKEAGAAIEELPLSRIGPRLRELVIPRNGVK